MKLAPLLAAGLALGACSVVLGGHPETCGDYPPGGGPAAIATQDAQLCDVVRLRVLRELDGRATLERSEIDRLLDRTLSWEQRHTVEELVAAIRKDAGDAMADGVLRAVDSVLKQGSLPVRADCPDAQRCLVKGAAKGARIALTYAVPKSPPSIATSGEAEKP